MLTHAYLLAKFTLSQTGEYILNQQQKDMLNLFKVNKKDTRTMSIGCHSGVLVITLEQI